MRLLPFLAPFALILLAACSPETRTPDATVSNVSVSKAPANPAVVEADRGARILAIGDSMLAWHEVSGASVADVVGRKLGEPVLNRAVGGAKVVYNLPLTGALGMRVASQFSDGPWDWVIVNGGGNDILFGCGCGDCTRRIDKMVDKSGTKGELPALFAQIRASGAKAVYAGYLRSPGVDSAIDVCRPEGDELDARMARLAEQMDGVWFISNADLVPEGDTSYHGIDLVHPSRKGSAAIGARIAALIAREDPDR